MPSSHPASSQPHKAEDDGDILDKNKLTQPHLDMIAAGEPRLFVPLVSLGLLLPSWRCYALNEKCGKSFIVSMINIFLSQGRETLSSELHPGGLFSRSQGSKNPSKPSDHDVLKLSSKLSGKIFPARFGSHVFVRKEQKIFN